MVLAVAVATALLAVCALAPALALAGNGGISNGGGTAPSTPSDVQVGSDIFVQSRNVMVRSKVTIKGIVPAALKGRSVAIQILDPKSGWVTIGRSAARADGKFAAAHRFGRVGRYPVRAVIQRGASATKTASEPAAITVHKPAVGTWYGPGLFGNPLACGGRLRRSTEGVAHKTLPCGTLVSLAYKGRAVVVPVIDRGPFVRGRTWDLTQATARDLHFQQMGTIGALVVGRQASK